MRPSMGRGLWPWEAPSGLPCFRRWETEVGREDSPGCAGRTALQPWAHPVTSLSLFPHLSMGLGGRCSGITESTCFFTEGRPA